MEQSHYLIRVGNSALLYFFAQSLAYLNRGLNSDIAHYHGFLKFLEQFLVDFRERVENSLDTAYKRVLGLFQTACNF